MPFMDLRTWFRVCLEKKTPDLFLLIACPDHLQYFSIVFTRLAASFLEALKGNLAVEVTHFRKWT